MNEKDKFNDPIDVEALKREIEERYNRIDRGGSGKVHRKHPTNFTPKKKRRK